MKTYRTLKPFVHESTRFDKGAEIALTTKQAEFLVTGGFIEPVAASDAAADPRHAEQPSKKPARKEEA